MTMVWFLTTFALTLFGLLVRSNLTLLLAILLVLATASHSFGFNIVTVIIMSLQGVLTAFMAAVRLLGFVQSDYLLFVSAISSLMLFSMLTEMFIQRKQKHTKETEASAGSAGASV